MKLIKTVHLFIVNCMSEHCEHAVPAGCTVGWAEKGGGDRVMVCNGERQEGMVGVLGGSLVA